MLIFKNWKRPSIVIKYYHSLNKSLYVRRTILQDAKKGGFYFGTPKTKQSKWTIPLTDEENSILEEQKRAQSKFKIKSKCWNKEWDGLAFTTINENPVSASTLRNMMIRIV